MKPSPNEEQLSAIGANMSQAIYSVRNSIIMLISLHFVLLYLDILRCMATHTHRWLLQDFTYIASGIASDWYVYIYRIASLSK